jgi:hypothetical protein
VNEAVNPYSHLRVRIETLSFRASQVSADHPCSRIEAAESRDAGDKPTPARITMSGMLAYRLTPLLGQVLSLL